MGLEDRPDYYDHTQPGEPRMPYAVSVALTYGKERAEAEWISAMGRGMLDPVVILVVDDPDRPEISTAKVCPRGLIAAAAGDDRAKLSAVLGSALPDRPMTIAVAIGEDLHFTDFGAPPSAP